MAKAVQDLLNSSKPINVTIVNGGFPGGYYDGVS